MLRVRSVPRNRKETDAALGRCYDSALRISTNLSSRQANQNTLSKRKVNRHSSMPCGIGKLRGTSAEV